MNLKMADRFRIKTGQYRLIVAFLVVYTTLMLVSVGVNVYKFIHACTKQIHPI